jgi:ataxin-3
MVDISNTNFNIYWEQQGRTRLCGLHCINSLLQGPYHEKDSLDMISSNLNELERKLLGEEIPKDYSNHAYDGNYNIQVISEALKIFGVELKQLKKTELMSLISSSNSENDCTSAIIFNSSTHWFCIRKINGIWFNLNSANPLPGPQIISEFYLSAFLNDTWDYGFNHFQVLNLPEIVLNQITSKPYQMYVEFKLIKQSKPKKINFGDTDDLEMEKAMEESLKNQSSNNKNSNNNDINNTNININNNELYDFVDDEEYLNMITQLSINDYFEDLNNKLSKEPDDNDKENVINVKVFKLEGKNLERRFKLEDKLEEVITFCRIQERINNKEIVLSLLPSNIKLENDLEIKSHLKSKSLENSNLNVSLNKTLREIYIEYKINNKDEGECVSEKSQINFLMKIN